jgi:hypothetical protein
VPDERGRVRCRARANREVRYLTPSEVTALVPRIYELAEDEETQEPQEPVLTQDATVLTQQARPKRRRA